MPLYTRYLSVTAASPREFSVRLDSVSPAELLQESVANSTDVRYSPVFPAYPAPNSDSHPVAKTLTSIAFLFANKPYQLLGQLRPTLRAGERDDAYFTQGLASVLLLNTTEKRLSDLLAVCPHPPSAEFWPLEDGVLRSETVRYLPADEPSSDEPPPALPTCREDSEAGVYIEQFSASITALWHGYGLHQRTERVTLSRIVAFVTRLIEQYELLTSPDTADPSDQITHQKMVNAIVSALVEISAALSYAVTQGTSGTHPILANRSPFPHHSLLGVGGSIRALTVFTRYLESAFSARDAADVIEKEYSSRTTSLPASITKFDSGTTYLLPDDDRKIEFDRGGELRNDKNMPLIAHFSLRHGYKESKFSVTAASEALSAEVCPQWTFMTLSHEIMHNRVRSIFQSLFGNSWGADEYSVIGTTQYREFKQWYETGSSSDASVTLDRELRNVVLNFCCTMERSRTPVSSQSEAVEIPNLKWLRDAFLRHKLLAIELFVHFHDYYFSYAKQNKLYMMSLWASWIKIAAPYSRAMEYLTRSLATVAAGTGNTPADAFAAAVECLKDTLDSLEESGVTSPLFDELRQLADTEAAFAMFKPAYYLMDHIQRFFASQIIARNIDRIEDDPFAEGTELADEYTSSVYVYADHDEAISPIRYSLASLFKSLTGKMPFDDPQWLTARNSMVISSQEVTLC